MDVSFVLSVGSFFVSERVLKPKATVLGILGCILIYDLTTKTHDAASLRAYRGESTVCARKPFQVEEKKRLVLAYLVLKTIIGEAVLNAFIGEATHTLLLLFIRPCTSCRHSDYGGLLITDMAEKRRSM